MNIEPRMQRAMKYQFVAMILNSFLASGIVFMLIWGMLPDSSDWVRIPLLMVGTYFVVGWLNQISLFLLNLIIYQGNFQEMAREAEHAAAVINGHAPPSIDKSQAIINLDLQIVDRPDNPIGRFMDADIFEWLHIKGTDGKLYRFMFEGTLDMTKGLPNQIPQDCLLLPPGILYKLKSPE